MADKGIIFSAPMVRALLDGRKSQTRRLLTSARVFATPEQGAFTLRGETLKRALQNADRWRHLGGDGWFWEADVFDYQAPEDRTGWMVHLPYSPGDRLYVREAAWIAPQGWTDSPANPMGPHRQEVAFAADDRSGYTAEAAKDYNLRLRPSIHMPRWASRLWLAVTDVRVQRLQNISEDDAQSEGLHHRNWEIESGDDMELCDGWSSDRFHAFKHGVGETAREGFELLWDSLHTTEGERWQDNPWIVAVSYDVHQGNIDGGQQ